MENEMPVSLAELAEQAANLKNELDAAELALDARKKEYQRVTSDILKTLEMMELDSFKGHGFTFFKETKASVPTPKTAEDKKMLFDYLNEKGIFLEYASVHSGSLNTLYKSLAEDALKDGILEFKLPGVGEPTYYTTLRLRRTK